MVIAGLLDELDEDLELVDLLDEDFEEDDDLELLDLLDEELLEEEVSSVLDEAEEDVSVELDDDDETTAELSELDELDELSELLSTGVITLDEVLWDSPPIGGLVCLHG